MSTSYFERYLYRNDLLPFPPTLVLFTGSPSLLKLAPSYTPHTRQTLTTPSANMRSPLLAVLLFLCAHRKIHGWSLLGGGDGRDATADEPAPSQSNTNRPLSSFKECTYQIPSDQPVNSHNRRDIEASVKAHSWPSTIFSPICEAWAYLDAGASIGKSRRPKQQINDSATSFAWKYLDALVERGGVPSLDSWIAQSDTKEYASWTFQNSTALALEAASQARQPNEATIDKHLLPLALSLRAHMPHCEMHRTLARDAAISFGLYDINDATMNPPAAFCVLSNVGKDTSNDGSKPILATQVFVDAALLPAALVALKSADRSVTVDGHDTNLLLPLPDERFNSDRMTSTESDDIIAILYGQVGTTAFASLYKSLQQSGVNFLVRHMGHVSYEEEVLLQVIDATNAPRAIPTALQGYGVRLDIRNVEYKAFDDGSSDKKDGNAEQDWNDAGHHPDHPARNEYLAGVNLGRLIGRFGNADSAPLPSDLQSLQTALLQSHPSQMRSESIVPPAWKRRSLSMQAATVIASSSDPLETLMGISQNLPSIAHSLTNVEVPESFEHLADEASNLATKVGAISPGWGDAAFGLYVNSRMVDVERPSFNVFQLLEVLREEDQKLRDLEDNMRPMLTRTTAALGRTETDHADTGWEALKSVRKAMDMGADKLIQMGKKGGDNVSSTIHLDGEDSDFADEDDYEESSSSKKKYRIDVGRGGKNAILYLNDIEKDPDYQSWPTSMEQMMYRAQFGGAPTVRRNLFTMLIVLDPVSGSHPSLEAVAQLLQSHFPLRVGVLMVNGEEVALGSTSKLESWNSGERPFHARDSYMIMKYITKTYGGMPAISCLLNSMYGAEDSVNTLSVKKYIASHVSILSQMGLVHGGAEEDVQRYLEQLLETVSASNKDYEAAVTFASEKLIRPGMSFLNGLPLPDATDVTSFGIGVNEVLHYEQRNVMEMTMKGEITDTTPRSIYASLLTGDNVFKQFHPLLRESAAEYTVVSQKSDEESLTIPTSTTTSVENVDAIFVIEGVFDLDSPEGIGGAKSLLDVIISPPDVWHESKSVSVAFRIVSSGTPTSSSAQVLSNLFCVASRFDATDLKKVVDAMDDASVVDSIASVVDVIEKIDGISKEVVETAKGELSCPVAENVPGRKNYYAANGRVYNPIGDPSISADDIKMLVDLESDRTCAMTKMILPNLLPIGQEVDLDKSKASLIHNAIGSSAALLNNMFSSAPSSNPRNSPTDIADAFASSEGKNPLFFSWNDSSSAHLQVEVAVILDPLTEPTQRVSPILIAIRDFLKLPIRLIMAPRILVENGLPLSSYYRFTFDPLASPDTNAPKALFQNLPINHLLTVRMDVPEPWDLQQAHAVQDADNLRCDAKYGCGDNAYILASKEVVSPETTTSEVGLTQMEYSLKSLLFFGQ